MRTPTALTLLVLFAPAVGCAPHGDRCPPASPPMTATAAPVPAPPPPESRHVYRFDFVLKATGDNAGTPTAFTINLEEGQKGEVAIGKNVPLSLAAAVPAPPHPGAQAQTPAPPPGSARQDIGLRVVAEFQARGEDVMLSVSTEMSTLDPPSIRKMTSKGDALASPSKSTLVTSLDDDHRHYELTVTPTKLR